MSATGSSDEKGIDFALRTLCPDGGCVGLMGPDGSCKECGLVSDNVLSDPRLRGLKTPAIEDSEESEINGDEEQSEHDPSDEEEDSEDEEEDSEDEEEDSEDEEEGSEDEEEDESSEQDSKEPGEFAERRLCPDGSCIGVIGLSGTCNECGTVL